MKKKIVTLSLLTLGICSLAMAAEYNNPEVGFKKYAAPSKEMKTADFGDHYKVETGIETTRQIASEEESDREPSSIKAKGKKKFEEPAPEIKEEAVEGPKPWMYRTNENSRN